MAVPKHKPSKQRTHSRKANWKISKPSIARCPNYGEMKPTHRVCSHCGYITTKLLSKRKKKNNIF